MANIIFITGGARSGKSSFAEDFAKKNSNKISYIATLNFFDEEMKNRIEQHKLRRDDNFETIEAHKNFLEVFKNINSDNIVLLDCITNMVSNLLLENQVDFENLSQNQINTFEVVINNEINQLLEAIKNHKNHCIIVSNELGMGLVPPYALGRIFRDIAGRINQRIAKEASEVYFVISGIPMKIKGDL